MISSSISLLRPDWYEIRPYLYKRKEGPGFAPHLTMHAVCSELLCFWFCPLPPSPISDAQLNSVHCCPRKIIIANDCSAFLLDEPIFPTWKEADIGFPGE